MSTIPKAPGDRAQIALAVVLLTASAVNFLLLYARL
jgi:hypothetical protein